MKPTRSYHAFTASHREPSGLRVLDFIVDRLDAWRGDRLPELIRILVVRSGNGNVALPLASLGYSVTALEGNPTAAERTRESAKDISVSMRCVEGTLDAVAAETFDVIIDLDTTGGVLRDELERLHQRCHPSGRLFVIARRSSISLFRAAGFKLQKQATRSCALVQLLPWLSRLSLKKGGTTFHALDHADAWMAGHVPQIGRDVMLEVAPYDNTRSLVVQLIPTFAAGGAERLVADLAQRLPERGYAMHVAALMGGGPLESVFVERHIPHVVFPKKGLFGCRAFWYALDYLKREQPEIVHTHLFGADLWGRLAALVMRVPHVVVTEHNIQPDESWVKRMIQRALVRSTEVFIAVSADVQRDLMRRAHVPKERIRVIRNGVDIGKIASRSSRPFYDVPKLLAVGRLAPQKGFATLLKALALVKRPWSLDIVGTGPLEADLRALAERLGIAPRIHWLGYRDDVPQLYAQADLFCMPSVWEGLGLAFVEAAAAGVPIIASDLPAFREVLPASAFTSVASSDVPAWVHALNDILEDPYEVTQRAQESAPQVRAAFSLDAMVAAYAVTYADILKNG